MEQEPTKLDDNGNPIYEALDDNGNPIEHVIANNPLETASEKINISNVPSPNQLNKPEPILNGSGPIQLSKRLWSEATKPLVTFGNEGGVLNRARQETQGDMPITSKIMNTGLGFAEGATSPLNLAVTGAFMGGNLLGSPGLIRAGKILSAPMAVEGGINLAHPDSSMMDRGLGALELAGGIAGMRAKIPESKLKLEGLVPSESINLGESSSKFFNPRSLKGTKILDDGIIHETSTGNLYNPKDKTVIVGQTTPDNIATLRERGFTPTSEVVPDGPNKGKPIMVQKKSVRDATLNEIPREESTFRKLWNASRGLMSVDLPYTTSAAFRQGSPWIGTKPWLQSWEKAAKAYGSAATFEDQMAQIKQSKYFKPQYDVKLKNGEWTRVPKPSAAEQAGVRITDVGDSREEAIASKWLENKMINSGIPGITQYGKHVAGSNRAFSAFMNHIRQVGFENLIESSPDVHWNEVLGKFDNPEEAKAIAEFINDSTGRGTMKAHVGVSKNLQKEYSLEHSAKLLNDTLFSPRLMASRINMMNPSTYLTASPFVRKEYTKAMLRSIGAWWSMASLAEIAGATVVKDPTSADFGKIKIGNTRLDPGAGFQQWMVLASRIKPKDLKIPGLEGTNTGFAGIDLSANLLGATGDRFTSSSSGKSTPLSSGGISKSPGDIIQDFGASKLHPNAKLIYDMVFASQNKPVPVMDRMVQMYIPMLTGDLMEVIKTNPELAPVVGAFSGLGGGSNTYEGGPEGSKFIPEKYDYLYRGKN